MEGKSNRPLKAGRFFSFSCRLSGQWPDSKFETFSSASYCKFATKRVSNDINS